MTIAINLLGCLLPNTPAQPARMANWQSEYAQAALFRHGGLNTPTANVYPDRERRGRRPDSDIKTDVLRHVQWCGRISDDGISVDVADGVVTLSGLLRSTADRLCSIKAAWVDGVRLVKALRLAVMTVPLAVPEPIARYDSAHSGAPTVAAPRTHRKPAFAHAPASASRGEPLGAFSAD